MFIWRRLLTCLLCLVTAASPALAAKKEKDEVNYLDLAALMLRDGKLDRAQSILERADPTEEGLDQLRYYTLSGILYLRLSKADLAAEKLQKAVEKRGAETIVYVYLAQARFQLKQYQDVLKALEQAGPALDHVASTYHMRAQCYWFLKDYAMAMGTLDVADRIFPADTSFLKRKVFFLIELGLYQKAADLGHVYLERSEGRREDYAALGNAMRAAGETNEAIKLLEQGNLKYPNDIDIKKILAHSYLDRGQLNTAAELVYEASLLDPSLTGEAAELYRRAGRPHRAIMLNSRITDQKVKFRQRLALLLELRRFEQVVSMTDDLKRVGLIDDQDIRYALAYADFKLADFDQAETNLQKLTRPDLFRKAAEMRHTIQNCAKAPWQCQ